MARAVAALAIIPYVAGMTIGAFEKTPDLFVSPSGWSVAVRGPDEKLALLASPREKFTAGRWLEADGDRRDPDEASTRAHRNCDALGCTVQSPQAGIVAVSYDRASLPDDCMRADVLILPRADAPANCARPKLVIDRKEIRNAKGISAAFHGDGNFAVRIYAQECGARPWCAPGPGGNQ